VFPVRLWDGPPLQGDDYELERGRIPQAASVGPSHFAGTFDDESGRDAHLNGKVAAALMEKAKAGDLFVGTPETHKTWNSRRQAAQIDPSRSRHDESTTVEDPFC
jgi:hypothetical protein